MNEYVSIKDTIGRGYNRFWNFEGRYRVVKGSRASKKSKTTALWYIANLIKYPTANLLVVRKTYRTLKDSCFADLKWAINRFGVGIDFKVVSSPLEIIYKPTGQKILFRGLDDPLKVTSITVETGSLCWLWIEEAYEIDKESDFDTVDESIRGAMIGNEFKQATLTFNPWNRGHWLKSRFFDREERGVLALTRDYRCNEWLDEADYQLFERMKEKNPDRYRVAGLGDWGDMGNLILVHYREKEFDCDPYKFDAISLGTDFGFSHAHCTLVLGWKDGAVYILDEVWVKQKHIESISAILDEKFAQYKFATMYCDTASPEQIKRLCEKGWRARAAKKNPGSVQAQIDWIKGTDLFIHPRCVKTLWEIAKWQWQTDKRTGEYLDEPVKIDDDAMAALRYGVEPWRTGPAARALGAKPRGW